MPLPLAAFSYQYVGFIKKYYEKMYEDFGLVATRNLLQLIKNQVLKSMFNRFTSIHSCYK